MSPRFRLGDRTRVINRATGGVTAPGGAAGGNTTAVGAAHKVPGPTRGGLGGVGGSGELGNPQTGATSPTGAVPPWDSRYEEQTAGNQKTYLNTIAGLGLQETALKQDYGLEGPYADAKTNPYSRAAALEQAYHQANKGTLNSAGNQLYAGSTTNHLEGNRTSYDRGRNELERSYLAELNELAAKRAEALQEQEEANRQAEWQRIERAEQQPLDPSQAPAGKKKQPAKKPEQKPKKNQAYLANARKAH